MGGKAADRAAKKQAAKRQEDDEPAQAGAVDSSTLVATAKQLVMDSVLVSYAPQVKKLVLEGVEFHKAAKSGHATESKPAENGEEKEKTDDDDQKEENQAEDEKNGKEERVCEPDALFDALASRLKFHNSLGLGLPVCGEDAQDAWSNFKNLEFDGGPRARKKGSPATDRLMANLNNNAAQYLHLLLALMVLRAFLFRSFFAFLPWFCVYQVASLMIPRGLLEDKLKVIHLHVGLRVAASVCVHAIMWFFFLFESLYKTYFLEKLLYVCVFLGHAYVFRPALLCPVQ